jgi:hypothetical protein
MELIDYDLEIELQREREEEGLPPEDPRDYDAELKDEE